MSGAEPPATASRGRLAWQMRLSWAHAVPPVARHIGLVIGLYTDEHGQQGVWLSALDLARLTGMGQSTVIRYRRILEDAGWVTQAGGAWFLAWPGELPLTAEMAEVLK